VRVSLFRSGDITGRRVGGTVDLSALQDEQRASLGALLGDEDRLQRAAGARPPPGAADIPSYEVVVHVADGATQRYEVSQACGDAALVDAFEAVLDAASQR
jgi:hypothetical protein